VTTQPVEVLVVDDEPVNVALVEQVLSRAGIARVEATTDPRAVAGLCTRLRPALILLDLRMPHLDGFEVVDLLDQSLGREQRPAVLMLTADITEAIRERAGMLGIDDLLLKPFDLDEVVARVGALLRQRA
jgi:DNA-binding response OmpR family regulator